MPPPALERRVVRGGLFEVPVRWAGQGRPLVFLHDVLDPDAGWEPDGPLRRLAERYLVLAPSHPGFAGATGLEQLEDLLDLAVYYLDFLDELLLDSPYLIGHGLGGLVAAEVAALAPRQIAKAVLVAPYGLGLGEAPGPDPGLGAVDAPAQALAAADEAAPAPSGSGAVRGAEHAVAGRFLQPAAIRGLRKRLHRLIAPTLLVWGARDPLVAPNAGEALRERLASARLLTLPDAGHAPHLDQPEAFAAAVLDFLDG